MNQYEALLNLNKAALYERLDTVQRIKDAYVAVDVIDILSNQKERDRRLISDYSDEELVTTTIKRIGGLKVVRMFTRKGLARYLSEGKIFDLTNACAYFSLVYEDPKIKEYHKFLATVSMSTPESATDNQKNKDKDGEMGALAPESYYSKNKYKTSPLLKWLFGKRKMCKALSEYCLISDVIAIFGESADVDSHKMRFLKDIIKA